MMSLTLVIAIIALTIWGVLVHATRGITYFGVGTDNEKMVRAAAAYRFTSWPSQIHQHPWGRAQLRDLWVVTLAIVQRVRRDRESDHPNVVLALTANAVASVLLFDVCRAYWSIPAAVVVTLLYLTSCWPYQIAMYMGHVLLSFMFLLLAVLCLQQTESVMWPTAGCWYGLSGAVIGLSVFSSSASRKCLPLYLGVLFFSLRNTIGAPPGSVAARMVLTAVLGALAILVRWKPCQTRLAHVGVLRTLIASALDRNGRRDPERVNRHALRLIEVGGRLLGVLTVYAFMNWWVDAPGVFYAAHAAALVGFLAVVVLLMLPNLVENLGRYVSWSRISQWNSHFRPHVDAFARRGIVVTEQTRGAGWGWVVRFFPRVVPWCSALFVASLACWVVLMAVGVVEQGAWAGVLGLVGLSLSPVLIGELTKGLQVGKAYFAGLPGMLVLIAATLSALGRLLAGNSRALFWLWLVVGFVVVGHALWNFWVFLDDVYPARMAPCWLGRRLEALGIRRFYTYETSHNDAFVNVLPDALRRRYDIVPIRQLTDVQEGYVVVPGTSAKALNMETQASAIEHGDFDDDPLLTRLIESRAIARYAVASFKTFGTSRFFVHESEVTTYRDLILREIGPSDRWRGRAWILDVKKLRASERLDAQPADAALIGEEAR